MSRSRRPAAVLAAVLLLVLVGGCGGTGQTTGEGSDDDVLDLPGVRDSAVEETQLDQDLEGRAAVVDMEPTADVSQVTGALAALDDLLDQGEVDTTRLYVGAGMLDLLDDPASAGVSGTRSDGGAAPAGERAELLLAGLATSADVVVVSGDGEPATVELRLEAEQPDPAAAAALAQEAAADDLLASATSVVRSVSEDGASSVEVLPGPRGMDDDLARDAGTLADALAALEGFEPVVARLDPQGVAGATVAVELVPEDGARVAPRELTTQAYGDALRPALAGLAAVLADQPDGASLQVVQQAEGDVFVDVRNDREPPARDRLGRTWNRFVLGLGT